MGTKKIGGSIYAPQRSLEYHCSRKECYFGEGLRRFFKYKANRNNPLPAGEPTEKLAESY